MTPPAEPPPTAILPPPITSEFGVVIGCCAGDYRFAKATVASVRTFLPELPIQLIVDGDFDTSKLVKAYGVRVLYRKDVRDDWLRQNSFGWGLTKMVAFWEAPFKRFLWLDADTVLWGDIRPYLKLSDPWDVLVDVPWEASTNTPRTRSVEADEVSRFWFNTAEIGKYFPDFPWPDYATRYFCTGVYGMRRDLFPLAEYQQVLTLTKAQNNLFFFAEMGFLNLMIFRGVHANRFRCEASPMQSIVCDFTPQLLNERVTLDCPPQDVQHSTGTVLHYTGGTKPTVLNLDLRSRPAMRFRRNAAAEMHGLKGPLATAMLYAEDGYARVAKKLFK